MSLTQVINWECIELKITKFNDESSVKSKIPDSITRIQGNLLTVKGMQSLWRCITGVAAVGTEWVPYSLDTMHIGVGNGETPATTTDTALNGALTAYQPITSITYDEEGSNDSASITVGASFGPGIAAWSWSEWALFNGDPSKASSEALPNIIMLNHKVETMGTKAEQATWVVEATIRLRNSKDNS